MSLLFLQGVQHRWASSPSSASPAIISKRFETRVSESLVHGGVPLRWLYFLPLLSGDPRGCVFSSRLCPETSRRDREAGGATCSGCGGFQGHGGEEGCVTLGVPVLQDLPLEVMAAAPPAPGDPQVPFGGVVPIPVYPHSLHSPISCLLRVLQTSLDKFT